MIGTSTVDDVSSCFVALCDDTSNGISGDTFSLSFNSNGTLDGKGCRVRFETVLLVVILSFDVSGGGGGSILIVVVDEVNGVTTGAVCCLGRCCSDSSGFVVFVPLPPTTDTGTCRNNCDIRSVLRCVVVVE
jgi:hypothetical protein